MDSAYKMRFRDCVEGICCYHASAEIRGRFRFLNPAMVTAPVRDYVLMAMKDRTRRTIMSRRPGPIQG
jgi:hypothetical protein